MNTADIKKIIRKYRISNGNILVIKGDPANESARILVDQFEAALKASRINDVFVVLVDDLDKITVMDTPIMNKHGWYRKEQILSLIRRVDVVEKKAQEGVVES